MRQVSSQTPLRGSMCQERPYNAKHWMYPEICRKQAHMQSVGSVQQEWWPVQSAGERAVGRRCCTVPALAAQTGGESTVLHLCPN
jgi:hypothetical protein